MDIPKYSLQSALINVEYCENDMIGTNDIELF